MHRTVLIGVMLSMMSVAAFANTPPADLVLVNARVTTLASSGDEAEAFAVTAGVFTAVGSDAEIEPMIGPETLVIDGAGRRVIPGLNDSHIHATRAGRFYNTELRWDGVASLNRGLEMVRLQAKRTPEGQWVRVVGGWSPYQFAERRPPTPAELTEAAPETPVFVLYLYSKGYLNRAGVKTLGLTADTPRVPGSRVEFTPDGGAILHAEPSPLILYKTVAGLPALSAEDQINSSLYFYRELNRFGITSVVDPGGGGHLFPDDYGTSSTLATDERLSVRVGMYLFAGDSGRELDQYQRWTRREQIGLNRATSLLGGYTVDGAGENLTATAADYENFLAERPVLSENMERELGSIVTLLATERWPIRIHATYDESIQRMLDVFEHVNTEVPFDGLRIAFDHVETISPESLARLASLGAGVAVQDRMAFAGESFLDRYGPEAASHAPPLRALVDAGIPVGAGTDATRVSSYNPWVSLAWMVTGRTVGGTVLYPPENRLTREEALHLYTVGSAWFTGEDDVKGRIAPGQLADFAVLSADYFAVPEDRIAHIESVLTVVNGKPVYASRSYSHAVAVPALPAPSPAWSPVGTFGGYQRD